MSLRREGLREKKKTCEKEIYILYTMCFLETKKNVDCDASIFFRGIFSDHLRMLSFRC